MTSLQELHDHKLNIDLMYLADLVEEAGISKTVPIDSDGAVSLSYAIAMLCGAISYPHVDDFAHLLDIIPAVNRRRFIYCWDALEFEFGSDIVAWSEYLGTEETVRGIRHLAKEIEHFKVSP
jgi:hypothetical protein